MMYLFMTLTDGTEVTHSEPRVQDGNEIVMVNFEKAVFGGFLSAWCELPSYHWSEIEGFTNEDIEELTEYLEGVAHQIQNSAYKAKLLNGMNTPLSECIEESEVEW